MAELLRSTSDVAMLDALLSIFESCVELFDMASTDDSDDDDTSGARVFRGSDGSEGAQVMLQVLHDALDLPLHPLLISGLARLFRALSAALVLPSQTYIKVAIAFFRALEVPTTYTVATEELRHMSHALIKYTEIQDRHQVLNDAITACQRSMQQRAAVKSHGDLLEAVFRMTRGLDAAAFGGFCNAILSPLVELSRSPDAQVTADAIVLMGRAIRGIDDPYLALSTTDQIWPVITRSIASLASSTCEDRNSPSARLRLGVLQFFIDVVTSCGATPLSRLQEIAFCCLQWLPLAAVSPLTLRCLSAVVSNGSAHRQRDDFYPVAEQIVKGSVTIIWREHLLVDAFSSDSSLHERLTIALTSSATASELAAEELIDLFMLLRQCVRFFPLVLAELEFAASIWRLACMLLTVDHQEQSLIDAACDWLLDVSASNELLSLPPMASLIQAELSVPLLRAAMTFVGPLQTPWTSPSYRPRNVWHFLFQLLHSPRLPECQRDIFRSTLRQLVTTDPTVLPTLQDASSRAQVVTALCSLHHRHRFLGHLSKHGNGAL
ncbi:hypothetical protein PINS_up018540 [Pythium insidiosum]|nr:hypothetical protein PINS_up018540 [Pythium insidiosum]